MPLIQFSNLNKYGTIRKRIMYTPTMPFRFNPKGLGPFVSVTIFKYRYEHYIPPTLFNANDGKRYILPTWQEVLPEIHSNLNLKAIQVHFIPLLKKEINTNVIVLVAGEQKIKSVNI
jgi:hypothetical protein